MNEKRQALICIKIQLKNLTQELASYRDYFSFMYNLTDSFSAINKMVRNGKINDSTLQIEMLTFCSKLKESFELLSKSDISIRRTYSVSIKVSPNQPKIATGANLNDIELVNLFRDISSFQDDTRNETLYSETHHLVSNNTAYKRIINSVCEKAKLCVYINNDVESDCDYLTSSRLCYTQGKIPYKSELVIPIIPLVRNQETIMLLGFLCITCNLKNGFELNDKEKKLMLTLTDCLYNLFSKWQKNQVTTN